MNHASELAHWESIRRSFLFIEIGNFTLDYGLTLFKSFNLSVQFIHFVFISENIVFVDVSHFEFEVFGAHGKLQIFSVFKLLVKTIIKRVINLRAYR